MMYRYQDVVTESKNPCERHNPPSLNTYLDRKPECLTAAGWVPDTPWEPYAAFTIEVRTQGYGQHVGYIYCVRWKRRLKKVSKNYNPPVC